jgi:protein TonB
MTAASDHSSTLALAEFRRDHSLPAPALSSRVTAGVLTAALAGLLVFFATHRSLWTSVPHPRTTETVTELIRDQPQEKVKPPPPEMMAQLVRPRAENPAPPSFTIAPQLPPPRASLPVTAAISSPLAGGVPAGTGVGGQGGVGSGGGNGNGNGQGGCWDPAWARAVTNRVRHFFYYPRRARDQGISGEVVLRLTVRRNGSLETLGIHKSSGSPILDAAALDTLNKAQPLPRIPDRMHVEKATGLFPMLYGTAESSDAGTGDCKT